MPCTATLTTEACRRLSPLSLLFSLCVPSCHIPKPISLQAGWGSALCQCLLFAHKYNDTCELPAATPPCQTPSIRGCCV